MLISLPIRLGHITVGKISTVKQFNRTYQMVEMLIELPITREESYSEETHTLLNATGSLALTYLLREGFIPGGSYLCKSFAVPTKH